MESLRQINADCYVLVTDEESRGELEADAAEAGFIVFDGPRDDVLKRYLLAAKEYEVDTVIRATGDNPLVDRQAASMLLDIHLEAAADYSSFDGPPIGTGVEILNTAALLKADAETTDSYDREHVSPYLYRHPEFFRINRISAPSEYCLPGSSVTIDTAEDYEYIRRLYRELYRGSPPEISEIIPWLERNRRPV